MVPDVAAADEADDDEEDDDVDVEAEAVVDVDVDAEVNGRPREDVVSNEEECDDDCLIFPPK